MIIFDLLCEPGQHAFEGWFASASEFDDQVQHQLVHCPVCHSSQVRKIPSASYIKAPAAPQRERQQTAHQLLTELIERVTRQSDDVGRQFAEEARKIHFQEVPARSIRGMATHEEVRELLDEGIPVLPLPGKPTDLH